MANGEHAPGDPWRVLPGQQSILASKVSKYLDKELEVSRLNEIDDWLHWAGRYNNIRPLHRQKLLGREIVITEKTDLHLIWYDNRIFVKPLPAFLLNFEFFEKELCEPVELYKYANGLLWSYTKLIQNESDFRIAKDSQLLPSRDISWKDWTQFFGEVEIQLNQRGPKDRRNKRYHFGELRLNRVNFIYRFLRRGSG